MTKSCANGGRSTPATPSLIPRLIERRELPVQVAVRHAGSGFVERDTRVGLFDRREPMPGYEMAHQPAHEAVPPFEDEIVERRVATDDRAVKGPRKRRRRQPPQDGARIVEPDGSRSSNAVKTFSSRRPVNHLRAVRRTVVSVGFGAELSRIAASSIRQIGSDAEVPDRRSRGRAPQPTSASTAGGCSDRRRRRWESRRGRPGSRAGRRSRCRRWSSRPAESRGWGIAPAPRPRSRGAPGRSAARPSRPGSAPPAHPDCTRRGPPVASCARASLATISYRPAYGAGPSCA